MIAPSLLAAALWLQSGPAPQVLTLEQALREARQKNLDIQQAEARLRQAQQLSAKAWSYYLPQIVAGGSYTHNSTGAEVTLPTGYYVQNMGTDQIPPPGTPGTPTPYALQPAGSITAVIQKQDQLGAQVDVKQTLIAPYLWPTIAAAYSGERVAGLSTENVRREVLFGVAQAYYGVTNLKQLVEVAERQLSLTREREKDARVRFQAGAAPKVALLRAEIDRAQAEQDLKRAQNAHESARLALATLLVRPVDFEVEIPPTPKPPEGDAEAAALRDRPDVLAAVSTVDLTREQRTAAWLQYAPSLGAFGQVTWANFTGFSGHETTWAAGLALSWNLLDGGLREAQIREANARVAEAEAARQNTETRAVEEVRQARLDMESALANKAKAAERVALARENERLVAVSYKAGSATYLESTDATESLRQAEISLVTESLAADLATLRLLKAAGAFREMMQ
ncbi:MAG TPA: TolC family protein [Anaeromyxobacteraceae bacterium]|nr:TolC family protein [Anaeromyxobacteraceae bacterium]